MKRKIIVTILAVILIIGIFLSSLRILQGCSDRPLLRYLKLLFHLYVRKGVSAIHSR